MAEINVFEKDEKPTSFGKGDYFISKSGTIVLCSGKIGLDADCFEGTLIKRGKENIVVEPGQYWTTWIKRCFKPFHGTIEINC